MGRKRQPHGDRPPRRRPEPPEDMPLPDPRAREGVMQEMVAGRCKEKPPTPTRRWAGRRTLMYQAFEEPDEKRRVQLAKDALAICPDCADAYVLLAEHAPSRKEALRLYEQGRCRRRAAPGGRKRFSEHVGHFWGVLETRPYMRARLGLAHALWTAGPA